MDEAALNDVAALRKRLLRILVGISKRESIEHPPAWNSSVSGFRESFGTGVLVDGAGLGDVYQGTFRGRAVALKTLRARMSDVLGTDARKVSSLGIGGRTLYSTSVHVAFNSVLASNY